MEKDCINHLSLFAYEFYGKRDGSYKTEKKKIDESK